MVIKYKASNLIEDFNLNAKTTLTELTEMFGTEIKKGTVLTEAQCNIAFEHYTKMAKTDDFANYLAKKAEAPKQEAKPAPKQDKGRQRYRENVFLKYSEYLLPPHLWERLQYLWY